MIDIKPASEVTVTKRKQTIAKIIDMLAKEEKDIDQILVIFSAQGKSIVSMACEDELIEDLSAFLLQNVVMPIDVSKPNLDS